MSGGFSPNTNYINGGSTGSSSGSSGSSSSSTGGSNSGGITYIPPSGGSNGSSGGNSSNSGGSTGSSSGSNGSNTGSSSTGSQATISQSIQANIGEEIQGALLSSVALIGLLIVLVGIGLAWKYFKRTAQEKNTEYYSSRADYFRQLNRYWDRRRGD